MKLKNLISKGTEPQQEDDKTVIDRNEEFAYYNMSKILKEDPDKLRFSQIENCSDILGEWSPHRINIIKKAFKEIMDYMVSKENLCILAAFKTMTIRDFNKRLEARSSIKDKLG